MVPILFLLCAAVLCVHAGPGGEEAALWGHVTSSDAVPLGGTRLTLTSSENGWVFAGLDSNPDGGFRMVGIPPGRYSLRAELAGYQSLEPQTLYLDPAVTLHVRLTMSLESEGFPSRMSRIRIDHTQNLHQTVLDADWIRGFPMAHNIWSLVENLDLSATTNRIDVGGLGSGLPALFSARGGTSWTQTSYRLNGLDVTDPYAPGQPLFYPDFYSLRYSQLGNAGLPPSALSPGGVFNLITPEGGDRLHGGASLFYLNHSLQSSNISPELQQEGLSESDGFHFMLDGNLWASGPLIPERLHFYASATAFDLSRDPAGFSEYDDSRLLSGMLGLTYRLGAGRLRFVWTGQNVTHDSYGAGRDVPFGATTVRNERFSTAQLLGEFRPGLHHFLKLGLAFAQGNFRSDFQEGSLPPHGRDLVTEELFGTAPMAGDERRRSLSLSLNGDLWLDGILGACHRVRYGLNLRVADASSRTSIRDDLHTRMWDGQAMEVVFTNTPLAHFESGREFSLFVQDSMTLANFLTLIVGGNLTTSRAWVPDHNEAFATVSPDPSSIDSCRIGWTNLAPRLGIVIPLTPRRGAALKISFSRYFYTLPLSYLTYGNPFALAGLVYEWHDANGDGEFQTGETGDLRRREGPGYSFIDPDIKRPRTDEYAISFVTGFGRSWSLTLSGFARNTANLINTLNVGVPFAAYTPEYHIDFGDDRAPNTYDDLVFTVFNQNPDTLGEDFYWLTNVESDTRKTIYYGADFTLIKRFGDRLTFFLSLTATQADGSTNPGNTEYQNDDGVVGSLFHDPNSLINAKGRVRFDRAYTGRLGLSYRAPWGIRCSCLIKYYDGQPFARKIAIEGFHQGPFFIQANPRGVSRYEYNRTIDVRIEKAFRLGETSRLRMVLDGFNILNRGLATEENEWTSPEYPERHATEIQAPRVFRLGLAFEF